jgi:hypothetical protein
LTKRKITNVALSKRSTTNQETQPMEIDHFLTLLGEQYEHLPKIAEQTFHSLGKEHAGYFTNLINDWIDILSAILDTYSKDDLSNSLIYLYFNGLLKEVTWFQLFFLVGNYPLIHRSLRYVWEMLFRAHYVETYPLDAPEPPGPTIDDKVRWLAQHERRMFRWEDFMKPRLQRLLPQVKDAEIEKCYKLLWDGLNEYVHPSKALLDRMVIEAPGSLMTDIFDKEWALETIETATTIFDLVWLVVISRFPKCAELLAQKGTHLEYPIIAAALENSQR